jgi:hypothetical protein
MGDRLVFASKHQTGKRLLDSVNKR